MRPCNNVVPHLPEPTRNIRFLIPVLLCGSLFRVVDNNLGLKNAFVSIIAPLSVIRYRHKILSKVHTVFTGLLFPINMNFSSVSSEFLQNSKIRLILNSDKHFMTLMIIKRLHEIPGNNPRFADILLFWTY